MLLLAPGVIAVGVGERTTPAGVERLAREVFADDLAHTVLAVPIAQERATMHLDTVCTMVDVDKIVMYPNVADSLVGARGHLAVRRRRPRHRRRAEPFLVAAAKAMGIDTLHQIDTGLDPVTAEREQWDDGNNTLAIWPRGWRWPTSATSRPTPGSRRPASRWSRSPVRSSARVVAGPAACPARSPATRSEATTRSCPKSGLCHEFRSFDAVSASERKGPAAVDGGCNNDRAPITYVFRGLVTTTRPGDATWSRRVVFSVVSGTVGSLLSGV